ncbi:hypothetical protein DDB_G0268896 [Dictyostelium discoideum AX4]|uniref:Uncharacterized protein n=1 Tax=Dictyostelium discoideum TaxID=44689 RepID=Q55EH6_DICDI|nr:hypothetical protein DDB_G0268896 [Dictyostelium discoideum AX4]EAL73037.1 hypothetical protein DDB_G0268896 [Dictyostelium discoideum AX4]|eukprot:XP_647044.1 hypothetical protein DDB_G0268896 [Dictyostelium discoideum AX4]
MTIFNSLTKLGNISSASKTSHSINMEAGESSDFGQNNSTNWGSGGGGMGGGGGMSGGGRGPIIIIINNRRRPGMQ